MKRFNDFPGTSNDRPCPAHCNWAFRTAIGIAIAFLLLWTTGCNAPGYEIAEVDGVLLIKGQPGHRIRVEFIPDVGVAGPRSVAETDTEGRFAMSVMSRDGNPLPGAVVGMHRVALSDLQLAASETGRGVPIRFGPEYTMASSTPLTQEVKPGKQTIEINIP